MSENVISVDIKGITDNPESGRDSYKPHKYGNNGNCTNSASDAGDSDTGDSDCEEHNYETDDEDNSDNHLCLNCNRKRCENTQSKCKLSTCKSCGVDISQAWTLDEGLEYCLDCYDRH
jgi:hypothetical protein